MSVAVRRQQSAIFWFMIGIPAVAVIASFATLFLAIRGAEPELPATYHWEGAALDQDLQRLQYAGQLGLQAQLQFGPDGRISLRPRFGDPLYLPPQTLTLRLSHATLPGNDRALTLRRNGDLWTGQSGALPAGHWRLELTDEHRWLLRSEFSAPLASLELHGLRPDSHTP
jgi:hypothetical protein